MHDGGAHLLRHVRRSPSCSASASAKPVAACGLLGAGAATLRPRRSRSRYPPPPAATSRMATTAISIGRRFMYVLYQWAPAKRTLGAIG